MTSLIPAELKRKISRLQDKLLKLNLLKKKASRDMGNREVQIKKAHKRLEIWAFLNEY